MARTLDPQTKAEISARLSFYREMGIYGLYRRPIAESADTIAVATESAAFEDDILPRKTKEFNGSAATALKRPAAGTVESRRIVRDSGRHWRLYPLCFA